MFEMTGAERQTAAARSSKLGVSLSALLMRPWRGGNNHGKRVPKNHEKRQAEKVWRFKYQRLAGRWRMERVGLTNKDAAACQ